LTIKIDFASIGPVHAGQDIEKGGLSRAIWPNYSDNFPGLNLKVKIVQGGQPTESLCQ
jgi:hypothetical protein